MAKGNKRVGVAKRLQQSLDRLLHGMDQFSNATVTASKPDDPCGYEKCLSMIDEIPSLVFGSSQYFLAIRILANKENRIAFHHMMQTRHDVTIGRLNTFSKDDI